MSKRFAYPKRPLLSQDLLMQERNVTLLTGDNVHLGAFMDSKHTSAKNVNFGMGLLGLISVDLQNNLQGDLYARWIHWVFSSF
jgi:hypothetical protein